MTETKQKRPPHSRQWWEKQVEACEKSGKTLSEFAKDNDINLGNLYAWKGKLRRKKTEAVENRVSLSDTVPEKQPRKESKKLSFLEVSVDRQEPEQVVITCPNGWAVTFSTTMDVKTLSRFLTTLEERS